MANSKPFDNQLLLLTAIITCGYQALFFLFAATFRIDKVTDFAGGTNFLILAIVTYLVAGEFQPRQTVISSFAIAWGLRLSLFLLYRILLWGEDRRFDNKRDSLMKTAVFWILQAMWVWSVSLPVTIMNADQDTKTEINSQDIIGWTMFAVGFFIETVADFQKLFFKRLPKGRDRWCNVGLWTFSRHPNYFGELLLWWGMFVSAQRVFSGSDWVAIIGPIFLTFLLLFLSGIPVLEASADSKYGHIAEYREYKCGTSPLIPFPSALYRPVPKLLKTVIFLDFPLYYNLNDDLSENESGPNAQESTYEPSP